MKVLGTCCGNCRDLVDFCTGHSRTIIGIEEQSRSAAALIVLDPSNTARELSRILADPSHCIAQLRQRLSQLKHRQYELVFVEGVLSEAEKEVRYCSLNYHHNTLDTADDEDYYTISEIPINNHYCKFMNNLLY